MSRGGWGGSVALQVVGGGYERCTHSLAWVHRTLLTADCSLPIAHMGGGSKLNDNTVVLTEISFPLFSTPPQFHQYHDDTMSINIHRPHNS